MSEKPILFSTPMVQAILAGRTRPPRKVRPNRLQSPQDYQLLAQRLLNGIALINQHGCWIWGKAKNVHKYGSLTWCHKTIGVHRLMYSYVHSIPLCDLDEICHDCPGGDNPSCINPAHLFEGTHGDNVRDMVRKGRHGGPPPPLLGERNPQAKLSQADVTTIRLQLKQNLRQHVIAANFGISQSQVSNINRGIRWIEQNL